MSAVPTMQRHLLDILACPRCHGDLRAGDDSDAEPVIEEGTLVCTACGAQYPVEGGIPRLGVGQELRRTRRGFSFQWRLRLRNAFEPPRTLYGQNIDDLVRWFFDAALSDPRDGGWMLDAGCGTGEKALAAARQHPGVQVVAMDVVDTLALGAQRAGGAPNLHFVQGDVMFPPFKAGRFRYLVSWGVLHHTNDTRLAFSRIAPLVEPGGRLLIWIYPDPSEDPLMKWYYQARDWHFLGLAHRLPNRLRLWLVRAYCVAALPALRYLHRTAVIPRYQRYGYVHVDGITTRDIYESSCFLLYDCLTPEFQFRHTRQEIMEWFTEEGLNGMETDGLGTYWAERSPNQAALTGRASPPGHP